MADEQGFYEIESSCYKHSHSKRSRYCYILSGFVILIFFLVRYAHFISCPSVSYS